MKYFSTQRPLTPGAFPNHLHHPVNLVNFDQKVFREEIGREAWGYVEYAEPLDPDTVRNYELTPAPIKTKTLHFHGIDQWGRETYEDEDGKLWKYSEPGEQPRLCHDILYTSTGNDLFGEPCWPMNADYDYKIEEI